MLYKYPSFPSDSKHFSTQVHVYFTNKSMTQHCFPKKIDSSLDWSNNSTMPQCCFGVYTTRNNAGQTQWPVRMLLHVTAFLKHLHLVDSFQKNPSELAAVSVLTPVKGTSLYKLTLYWAQSRMSKFWRNVKPCQASTAAAPLNKQEFRAWMPCQFIWDQKPQSFTDNVPRPVIDLTEWLIGNKCF